MFCLGMGSALGGCESITTSPRAAMRPVPLVEYSLMLSYVDPATGRLVGPEGGAGLAGSGPVPTPLSPNYVPVVDSAVLAFAKESPANRDFVQDALMQRADVLCEGFIDGMYIRVTERKMVLGEIAMAASAVGAFTGGNAAQALNLVSALAQGTNTLADSTVMQNQLVTLIANQIQANRTRIRDQITAKRTQGLPAYPVSLALRDAQAYHQSCSFMSGVSSLAATSSKPDAAAANAVSATAAEKAKP